MFKNRSLQVKMVKDDEEPTDVVTQVDSFEIKAEVVADQAMRVLTFIGMGVLSYVAADTIRQVAIARARR